MSSTWLGGELGVIGAWRLFKSLLKLVETEIKMTVIIIRILSTNTDLATLDCWKRNPFWKNTITQTHWCVNHMLVWWIECFGRVKLFASSLKSVETEIWITMTNKPISIHWHSFCDIRLLKNKILLRRIQLHKHTDESITCLCGELSSLDVWSCSRVR